MKKLWSLINLIIISGILSQFSCDERAPKEDTVGDNYKLSLVFANPVYDSAVIGEDVVDPPDIKTRLQFKLENVEADTSTPVSGEIISFSANYGSFDINPVETNENGIVEVFYEDGGDSGRVLVTAKYNESVKK